MPKIAGAYAIEVPDDLFEQAEVVHKFREGYKQFEELVKSLGGDITPPRSAGRADRGDAPPPRNKGGRPVGWRKKRDNSGTTAHLSPLPDTAA